MPDDSQKDRDRDAILAAKRNLESLTASAEYQMQGQAVVSKFYKARFDSLVDCGFTSEQALEIIKARGLAT